MVDQSFYNNKGPFTLKEISGFLSCESKGDDNKIIHDLCTIEDSNNNSICFYSSEKYRKFFTESNAGAYIVEKDLKYIDNNKNYIFSNNPHFDLAKISLLFYPDSEYPNFSFSDNENKNIKKKSGNFSYNSFIHKTAKIGKNCEIGNNSIIGPNVHLGDNCLIGDNVSIYFSLIGNNVKIYQGVKLGSEGFGFIMDKTAFKKIPQLGRVLIGNFVEIGANSTVDRGSIGDTIIDDYCMIDNIVHLGHNVKMGKRCIVAAMTGISGSTTIGNNVIIGGQVGISGHINIGNNVKIAAKTGVMKNIQDNSVIGGYPSEKILDWHRNTLILKKLRRK